VRELSHLMERVTLLSSETIIDHQVLERLCLPQPEPAPQMLSLAVGGDAAPLDEPACIRQALLHAEGNVMRTARLLGISRGALRYRMRQYGIDPANCKDLGQLFGSFSRGTIAPPTLLAIRGRIASLVDSEDAARHPPASQARTELEPCWEQRPATVLEISLTFPSAEGPAIPHDDPWALVSHWEQCIVRQLTRFGGIILQRSTAVFPTLFGVHGTLEQLPQRTVQPALAIRHAITDMTRSEVREARVELRMAAHQGIALVDVQTYNPKTRVLPMADVMTLPLRLLGDAAPGEILLSPR
jgi:Bacterial regulatory protein, Fis family